MRSLLALLDVHATLREQFAVHRDYVVGLDFGRAFAELEAFEKELRQHMDLEETLLLPLYRERVGKVLGGDPDLFLLEHKNLLKNLDAAKEALARLAANPASGRRQAHEFLDQEWMLLHLLEHHDEREKNTLYPKLDLALSDHERKDLLARCGLKRD